MPSLVVVGTNSYVTVAEVASYAALSTNGADWSSASETEKDAAIVSAARSIDRQPLKGRKYDWWTPQGMAFPRYVTKYLDYASSISFTSIPQQVKDAQCEEALSLYAHQNDARLELARLGMSAATIDGATEAYKDDMGKGLISEIAKELLRPWLATVVDIL